MTFKDKLIVIRNTITTSKETLERLEQIKISSAKQKLEYEAQAQVEDIKCIFIDLMSGSKSNTIMNLLLKGRVREILDLMFKGKSVLDLMLKEDSVDAIIRLNNHNPEYKALLTELCQAEGIIADTSPGYGFMEEDSKTGESYWCHAKFTINYINKKRRGSDKIKHGIQKKIKSHKQNNI